DLEPRNRDRMRGRREHQVAVFLVRVRLLRIRLDSDHPAPDGSRVVAQGAFEGEVRRRVWRDVLLEGVVIEVLLAVGEVRAGHPGRCALPRESVLNPDLALLRAEAAADPVDLR